MFTTKSIFGITGTLDIVLSILLVLMAFYQFFTYMSIFKATHYEYYKHLLYAIGCLVLSGGLYLIESKAQSIIYNINWHHFFDFCAIVIVWLLMIICIQILWQVICKSYGSQIKHISLNKNDNVQMFKDWVNDGHYHDPQNKDK